MSDGHGLDNKSQDSEAKQDYEGVEFEMQTELNN